VPCPDDARNGSSRVARYWFLSARKWFTGPRVQGSVEAFYKMEDALDEKATRRDP
jgi:hypothetical protein